MKQYFFMFSEGSYSDYGPTGLYVCDHPVSHDEWKEHYGAWEAEYRVLRGRVEEKYGTFWNEGARESFERKAADEFGNIGPESTFAALHGMLPVEYEELWRDF